MDMSDGYELISLTSESNKHLSSIAINNVNLLSGLSPAPFVLSFYNFYYPVNRFYAFIYEIFRIFFCCCDIKCKCTCKCVPECKGNFICLCVCKGAKLPSSNECCICICKKDKDTCNCICICICKNGEKCRCAPDKSHDCEQCLVKIDIQSLLCDTSKILCDLRWIRWYLYEQSENNYISIISRIHSIELLFKKIGTKITQLMELKNILSYYSKIGKTCKQCCSSTQDTSIGKILQPLLGLILDVVMVSFNYITRNNSSAESNCKDKIKNLIEYIERALHYYLLFGSRIKDINILVDYKTFSPQANEIIEKLKLSVQPLLNQLSLLNLETVNGVDYSGTLNKLLVLVYSHYWIFQCFLSLYTLLQCSSKLGFIIYVIEHVECCTCVKNFRPNNKNGFKIYDFYKYLLESPYKNMDVFKKMILNKDGNHTCLCLVIKFVLYPLLIKSMFCIKQTYMDSLSKLTKEFIPNMFMGIRLKDVTKILFFVFGLIYKMSVYIESKYELYFVVSTAPVYLKCYCTYNDDPYYPYLISIIIFVSSLIENMWTMDPESIRVAIESLSSLVSEYQSIHVYTHYGSGKSIPHVSGSTKSQGLNLSLMKFIQYNMKISITTTTNNRNGACNSNGNCEGAIASQLTKSEALLINTSVKSVFKIVLSSLSILITTPLLSIAYSNISGLAFYIIENGKKIGLSSKRLRTGLVFISKKYLECPKERECKCLEKNGCKICLVGRIIYLGLYTTLNTIRFALRSVIKHLVVDSLKLTTKVKIEFVRNACVNGIIEMLIMTKNNLTYSSHPNLNTNISVEKRNWGYDTLYEHKITYNSIKNDGYPNLLNAGNSYRSGGKMFKLVLTRLLIAAVILEMFVYMRLKYQPFMENTTDIENNLSKS